MCLFLNETDLQHLILLRETERVRHLDVCGGQGGVVGGDHGLKGAVQGRERQRHRDQGRQRPRETETKRVRQRE